MVSYLKKINKKYCIIEEKDPGSCLGFDKSSTNRPKYKWVGNSALNSLDFTKQNVNGLADGTCFQFFPNWP